MIPRIRHRRKTLLVVTDSQSLLAALNKGPLSQTGWTGDQIWQRLLTLTCAGWSVHLQFCYGHCGVHANELADQYATQTMKSGQYTEQGIAPLWHTDLLTCFTTQLTNKWRSTIRQDTHRYLLCGTRPSDLSGKDLITQEVLHRQELVRLARARCGESELWGRLYWAVRDCTNQCRFCNILTGTVCIYALQQRSNCTGDGHCSPVGEGGRRLFSNETDRHTPSEGEMSAL
ncbi:putative RNase H [Trypanosoma cruzi]|nr:putative RNase H [Trypanosoma cruzi]